MSSIQEPSTFREHLIEGIFTPQEAKEVLLVLIDKKINFHNNNVFSKWERFGEHCEFSEARLKELRATRQNILKMVEEAEKAGKNVNLGCTIEINTTDEQRSC